MSGLAALLFGAFLLWILPVYVAHQIGQPKHRLGLVWGLFLGWIGVIVVALLPAKNRLQTPGS